MASRSLPVTAISTRLWPDESCREPYFIAFSIRFSATRVSSSRSPVTIKGPSALSAKLTRISCASGARLSTTWRVTRQRSTMPSGRKCCFCSMRDKESKSSINRDIRWPCSRIIGRNFSRALGSSLAEPCRVSTKPSIEASGVRNSWLALAIKSTRILSTRRCSVKSRKVIKVAKTFPASSLNGATQTSKRRSTGTRSLHCTLCACPPAIARRRASMTVGARIARTK